MLTREQLDLIECGRLHCFVDPAEWKNILYRFCNVGTVEELDRSAAVRLLDLLSVAGFRDRRLPLISSDYIALLRRWQMSMNMQDKAFEALLFACGFVRQPEELDGVSFGRVVNFFLMNGCGSRTSLARSVMTRKQLALLHVAKRELDFNDVSFAAALRTYGGGVASAADLDQRGFDRLLVYFEVMGFVPNKRQSPAKPQAGFGHRKGMATPAQVELIQGLWRDWNGSDDAAALGRWLEKSYGVSALRFLKQNEAGKAITGLRAMVRRRKGAAA
ncbi:regulatory protein GemA [Microvirga sp. CF3062]|uniref:regulatory protein GemA n=1 Tax=Microvirga sp. CF3062 TaxID=3110182 RepID=UPI002E7822D6|nr:regulatory protein GemA [Microvirga sp. CF3062]MEE1656485.1 regulatory protein GemA [Microvirga sp. CF3062]